MKKSYEGEGLIVYIHFEDTRASVITEVHPIPDLLPEDFKFFIENWASCAAKLNPLIEEVKLLEPVQGYGVGRTVAVLPWPLSKRVMYTARYPCLDYKPSEYLFLMSERGAESRMSFTEEDAKSFALARLFVAGWHFSPEFDNEGIEIGTKIFYV